MYRQDYILKAIEMMGDLIAALLGLLKQGKHEQAEQKLDKAYDDFLNEDSTFFKSIPKDELTTKLLQEHNYTNGHLEILAELFRVQAELFYGQDKNELSLEFYEKSLILHEFVISESNTFDFTKQAKLEKISSRIKELS